jgi:Protein of unknown function (DUF2637)
MTVQVDKPATITAARNPEHMAALDQRRSLADKIRYGCEQVDDPVTTVVRDWLAAYDVLPTRSYVSSVVNAWRKDQGMSASTGDLPKLTPELLAELDAITAPPAAPLRNPQPVPVQPGRTPRPRGWLVAWVSFVVGGIVSVAANVAHTIYPTQAQLAAWTARGQSADSWSPSPGAMAFAAFWPVALILSVEVITRVTWRPGFLFGLARYGGTTLVAAVAAVMSYRHMSGLLAIWGEDSWGAHLGPLAVDGLMVVAAAALLSMSREKAADSQ